MLDNWALSLNCSFRSGHVLPHSSSPRPFLVPLESSAHTCKHLYRPSFYLEHLPTVTVHLIVVKSQLKCHCLQKGHLRFFPESSRPGKVIIPVCCPPLGMVLTMPQQSPACLPSQPECGQDGMGSDMLLTPPDPLGASMQERPVNIGETDEEKS